jgi:hypothetical protein
MSARLSTGKQLFLSQHRHQADVVVDGSAVGVAARSLSKRSRRESVGFTLNVANADSKFSAPTFDSACGVSDAWR